MELSLVQICGLVTILILVIGTIVVYKKLEEKKK